LVAPQSAVDVGRGIGTWLFALAELVCANVRGYDGDSVDRRYRVIDQARFTPIDWLKS
jgi:hypothetical protein